MQSATDDDVIWLNCWCKIGIFASEVRSFAKKSKISYATLAAYKNLINYFKSSQDKSLAKLDDQQKCLTGWQNGGKGQI